jgi:hypothetical protein
VVKVTVYVPALVYVCTGFFSVELVPSPKVHLYEVGDPVLLSVNTTFSDATPEVGEPENAATGLCIVTVTYRDLVTVLLPAAFEAVKVTVYVPAWLYVCTGFFSFELVPSPKSQFHEVGVFVLLSVKLTLRGILPEVLLPESAATGTLGGAKTLT